MSAIRDFEFFNVFPRVQSKVERMMEEDTLRNKKKEKRRKI